MRTKNLPSAASLHHFAVKAWEVERLASFYQTIFGWKLERRLDDQYGLCSVWLRASFGRVMVERSEVGGDTRGDFFNDPIGYHLLALHIAVLEVRRWRRHLADNGVTIVHETDYTLYFCDPEGNRFGLSTYPDPLLVKGGLDELDVEA